MGLFSCLCFSHTTLKSRPRKNTVLEFQQTWIHSPTLSLAGSEELSVLRQRFKVTLSFQVIICEMGKNTYVGSFARRIKGDNVYEVSSLGADLRKVPKTYSLSLSLPGLPHPPPQIPGAHPWPGERGAEDTLP